jgi:predicted CXXCH cytochrome family protein
MEADAAALGADIPVRTYKCALCHQFHLTSRTKGLRPPRPPMTEGVIG